MCVVVVALLARQWMNDDVVVVAVAVLWQHLIRHSRIGACTWGLRDQVDAVEFSIDESDCCAFS